MDCYSCLDYAVSERLLSMHRFVCYTLDLTHVPPGAVCNSLALGSYLCCIGGIINASSRFVDS